MCWTLREDFHFVQDIVFGTEDIHFDQFKTYLLEVNRECSFLSFTRYIFWGLREDVHFELSKI